MTYLTWNSSMYFRVNCFSYFSKILTNEHMSILPVQERCIWVHLEGIHEVIVEKVDKLHMATFKNFETSGWTKARDFRRAYTII